MYKNKIFNQSIVYGLGVFFPSLLNLFLLPVYTRYLSVKAFGELSLIWAAIFFLQYIFNMGLYSGFMIRYFDFEIDDLISKKRLISTVLMFYIVFSFIVTSFILLFHDYMSNLMIGREDIFVLFCVLMIVLFETLLTLPMLMFRIRESSINYSILNISRSVGLFILVFIFLKYFKGGIKEAVIAQMIVLGLMVFAAYFLTRKEYVLHFNFKELWDCFKLGLPIFIIMIAFWFVDFSNRFLVKQFLTIESLALYALGFKLGQLILSFITIFQTLWQPMKFRIFKENDAKKIYSDVFTYYVLALVSVVLIISLFSQEFILVFSTEDYLSAASIVTLVAISYALFGFYYYLQTPLLVNKKLYTVAAFGCFSAVLNVILSYILIPVYGIKGAIFSIFITYSVLVLAIFVVAQRNYKIPYDYQRLCKILVASIVVYVCSGFFERGLGLISLYKVANLILFYGFLFLFKFFNKSELLYLKTKLKKG